MPMEFELGGDSNPPNQCETAQKCSFADLVAGWDTSVFRPTPTEKASLPVKHSAGTGQLGVRFVTPTVPVSSRPIRLVHNGCPLAPLPSSHVLLGKLPESVVWTWSDLGSQYVA